MLPILQCMGAYYMDSQNAHCTSGSSPPVPRPYEVARAAYLESLS